MAAPLQDSGSLESRKPISLNSQRAAERDSEVLHSNFTASNPHHCEGAEGLVRWQPEGKEMGSESGCIPFYPILSYLPFSTFLSPQTSSEKFNTFTGTHRHTNFSSTTHCVLCGFTISASPQGLVSLLPQLPVRKL